MNANVLPFNAPDPTFGLCPVCGHMDGYFNIRKLHFGYCNAHRTQWGFGRNVLSSWQHETEADWEANAKRYGSYRVVEPIFHWRDRQNQGRTA